MKTELFQSCSHCWVFLICRYIECSTFTASSFRIWKSPTGIPSPPLALFIVMLPKAHLTLHSRMSVSRWVITPSWLSGSWSSFLYISSVYSYHLFLISSASVRSMPFLSFIVPYFAWNGSLVSNFLKEISSLSHSIVFLYFLHWLLRKASYLSLLFFGTLHSNGYIFPSLGLPWWLRCKASAYNEGDPGSIPGLGRSPGEGNGNPLQYSCLEKSHRQRSLVGYSPWGRKESDMTERLHSLYIFPFLLRLYLLFFSQLFLRPIFKF